MKPKLQYRIVLLWTSLVILIAQSSCKKLVTVPAPYTQLVTADVFSENSSATAAMTVIYAQMISQDMMTLYLPYLTGLSGDELQNYSTVPDYMAFYTNSLTSQTATVDANLWTPAYNYIYQANAVIAGVQASKTLSPAVTKQLTGEAEFIRAFWHFYLTNLFGDVPLITTTFYNVTAVAPRTAQSKVYAQIVTDLTDAQSLLSENFVDASDTTVTTERTRPTTWAAAALLARVYLFTGDWIHAEQESTLVINNSALFQLVTPLANVFLQNSNEAIWQIEPVGVNLNTPEGGAFILTTPPANSSTFNQTATISSQLLHSFEPNDARLASWVGNVDSFYFPYKYKADLSASSTTEYEMVLRLAEQYLIRAEARAEQGNLIGAAADLNIIRERAGLPDTTASTQSGFLNLVYHERQVELFTEWGHRWLDLKRTANVNAVMGSPGNVAAAKGGNWTPDAQLYPIPQTEITNNPFLTQNEGY